MDTSKIVIKVARDFLADLILSDKDKKVIDAFTDKKALTGKKLSTDGKTLDGSWMGGNKLAHWEGDKIVINDVGSKAGDVVARYLRKIAPKNFFAAEGMFDIGKTYQVVTEFSAYWVEGHEAVSPHSGETSTAVNLLEGNLVKVLRKRGSWYEAKLLHPIRLTDNGKTFTHQGEVLISSMDADNLMEK